MGSPGGEAGRDYILSELRHEVTLTHSFIIRSTEVSQEEFEDIMGYNPSQFSDCGRRCPVDSVNWHQAAAYCNALSEAEGRDECFECAGGGTSVTCSLSSAFSSPYECTGYRLPTEAEWEKAARAGVAEATYSGDLDVTDCSESAILDPIAWYCGNAGNSIHETGEKEPNGWGLYDMLGNAWEWCFDWVGDYSGNATDPFAGDVTAEPMRVVRGGSWEQAAKSARAAARDRYEPNNRSNNVGFRVVRSNGTE
jgi:formylglycine-generating enzyme required for sulfatase activity